METPKKGDEHTLHDMDGNFIQTKRVTKVQAMRRAKMRRGPSDGIDKSAKPRPTIGAAKATHGQRQASFVLLLAKRNEDKP
jgi:hypothetical protein